METQTETQELKKVKLIVGGVRLTKAGKKLYTYYYEPNGNNDQECIAFVKQVVSARPGQVFIFSQASDEKWVTSGTNSPKYVGLYEDESFRAYLIAQNDACETEYTRVAKINRDKTDNALKALVEPIGAIYEKLPWSQRAAFLMVVQEMVVRPNSNRLKPSGRTYSLPD